MSLTRHGDPQALVKPFLAGPLVAQELEVENVEKLDGAACECDGSAGEHDHEARAD